MLKMYFFESRNLLTSLSLSILFCLSISANATISVSKTQVKSGEKYTLTWPTNDNIVGVWEELDGVQTRQFNPMSGSVTLAKPRAGHFVYKFRRCASSCSPTPYSIGVTVTKRVCNSWDDMYEYSRSFDEEELGGCRVNATQSYSGYGKVDVKIFSGSSGIRNTSRLLYVVGGYEIGEFLDVEATMLGVRNQLQSAGYGDVDLVYFDYSDYNFDYAQNKGYALVEGIKKIDQLRGGAEPSVMVGVSLGGVVGRYALVKLENSSYSHNVEKFISLDSPHLGANVPLGLQSVPLFLRDAFANAANDNNGGVWNELVQIFKPGVQHMVEAAREGSDVARLVFRDLLENVSAKQLIIQHRGYGNSRHSLANSLISELNSLGFPGYSENIGIAYGSDSGGSYFTNESSYFSYDSDDTANPADIRLVLRPYVAGNNYTGSNYFYGHLGYDNTYGGTSSYGRTWGTSVPKIDIIPCSTIDLPEEMITILKRELSSTFDVSGLNANLSEACFIPTLSALAIDSVPIYSRNNYDLHSLSPFDTVVVSGGNKRHDAQFNDVETQNVMLDAVDSVYGTLTSSSSSSSSSSGSTSCGPNAGKTYGVVCPGQWDGATSYCGACSTQSTSGGMSGCVNVSCGY